LLPRFLHARKFTGFMTTLLACGAFLVGAVRIWGVPPDKIWSGLLMIGIIIAVILVFSFCAMLLIRAVKTFRSRD
jgi:hypothetical protein